jgi:hypothetical protein
VRWEKQAVTRELTLLERALIVLTARENWPGFRDDCIRVTRRENTGVGRFTYLEDENGQKLTDGFYSAQGRNIEIPGVPYGSCFEIAVSSASVAYIEMVTSGDVGWDGSEVGWSIV